jgi:hypothetical protein
MRIIRGVILESKLPPYFFSETIKVRENYGFREALAI